MLSRDEIETVLARDLAAAKRRNIVAGEAFQTVIKDVPSGIPSPDGEYRITLAGAEHSEALQDLYRTLVRFNDFVVHGIIPEDLKNR
jgi:hypothetical protein